VKAAPFRIEPTFHPRIWGERSLAPIYPLKTQLPQPIGEAWLTETSCMVVNGPFAAMTLGQAWQEMTPDWRGPRVRHAGRRAGKIISLADKLSVHDRTTIMQRCKAGGRTRKTRCGTCAAKSEAELLLGLKHGRRRKVLGCTVRRLGEFSAYRVRKTRFVPPGIPHPSAAE
jgi:mannose-6-phosphate isomerase class I